MNGWSPDFSLTKKDHLNAARFYLEKAEEAMGFSLTETVYPMGTEPPETKPDLGAVTAFAALVEMHIKLSDLAEGDTTQ